MLDFRTNCTFGNDHLSKQLCGNFRWIVAELGLMCVFYTTPDCSQLWFDHASASEILKLFSDFHGGESRDSARAQAIFTELQCGSAYAPLASSAQLTMCVGTQYTSLFRDLV